MQAQLNCRIQGIFWYGNFQIQLKYIGNKAGKTYAIEPDLD